MPLRHRDVATAVLEVLLDLLRDLICLYSFRPELGALHRNRSHVIAAAVRGVCDRCFKQLGHVVLHLLKMYIVEQAYVLHLNAMARSWRYLCTSVSWSLTNTNRLTSTEAALKWAM